jgi:hypothetical protein
MALIQCIFIVTLQAAICVQNSLEADQLPSVDSNVLLSSSNNAMIPQRAAYRLGRIKWENIAFMGFQFWFLGMAIDAVGFFLFSIHYIKITCSVDSLSKYSRNISVGCR